MNLRIQSEYSKLRTRNNTAFGHFSRSATDFWGFYNGTCNLTYRTSLGDCFYISREAVTCSCSLENVSLKSSQNSQENTCARVSFLIKLQSSSMQVYYKRDSGKKAFSCEFGKTFKNTFFYRTPPLAASVSINYWPEQYLQHTFEYTTWDFRYSETALNKKSRWKKICVFQIMLKWLQLFCKIIFSNIPRWFISMDFVKIRWTDIVVM